MAVRLNASRVVASAGLAHRVGPDQEHVARSGVTPHTYPDRGDLSPDRRRLDRPTPRRNGPCPCWQIKGAPSPGVDNHPDTTADVVTPLDGELAPPAGPGGRCRLPRAGSPPPAPPPRGRGRSWLCTKLTRHATNRFATLQTGQRVQAPHWSGFPASLHTRPSPGLESSQSSAALLPPQISGGRRPPLRAHQLCKSPVA